jgi:hypothetical protein
MMKTIAIWNCNTNKDALADVLEESDKRLRVVLKDTTATLDLHRTDVRYPYIGHAFGMEFETFGDEE